MKLRSRERKKQKEKTQDRKEAQRTYHPQHRLRSRTKRKEKKRRMKTINENENWLFREQPARHGLSPASKSPRPTGSAIRRAGIYMQRTAPTVPADGSYPARKAVLKEKAAAIKSGWGEPSFGATRACVTAPQTAAAVV